MRIIAGKHKNRVIPSAKDANYRPSTSKFKEALFSILSSGEFMEEQPLTGAKVLDLFSGTGALAFEAISRGAAFATLIDINEEYLNTAEIFAKKIGEWNNTEFLKTNAAHLPLSPYKYNVIFIDPPYNSGFVEKSLESLVKKEWLAKGAIIAIEVDKFENIKTPNNFKLLKEKIYSKNKLLIYRYEQN